MRKRVVFFRLQDGTTVMIYIDLSDNTFEVKAWENFLVPTQKLTGWLPVETAYKTVIDVIIRHGGVLEEVVE